MPKTLLPILILALFLVPGFSEAALVYTPQDGWNLEGPEGTVQSRNSADQMRKAEEYENARDFKRAIVAYRTLVKKWPKSMYAVKAQLKYATLSEKVGDIDRAFEQYGIYISKYPRGEDFDKCVESEFRIAKLFLEGAKQKVFGIPVLASMTRAQQMFEEIVKSAPYSPYAPLSQFNSGVALEKQEKYPEAIQAYEGVLSKYPSESVAADAQYQIGYVLLKEARQGSYDQADATKAREAFEDFIARYPNSEKVPQARENMASLTGRQTENTFDIARFYDKKKDYKAAVIYYNQVIKEQPGSPQSVSAKARIEALRGKVGESALAEAPAPAQNGSRAQEARKMQAQVDTASRSDYSGPPVSMPEPTPAAKPKVRASPLDIGPVPAVEPPLPSQ